MTRNKSLIVLFGLSIAALSSVVWVLFSGQQEGSVADKSEVGSRGTPPPVQEEEINRKLEVQLQESRAESLESAAKARELQERLAAAEAKPRQAPNPAEWIRDPEMIKVFKGEAASAAKRSATALLEAGLAEHLQLNQEQSDALKKLLIERTSVVWDNMLLPITVGELDEAGRAAAGRATKQALERNVTDLKALVGEDGFKTVEWFEQTQPDRDTVKRFTPQFAQAGQELNAEQQSYLLTVTTEERTNFPFTYDLGDPLKMDYEHWDENFTDEKLKTHFEQMAQLNDRIVQRAQLLLTPEQVALLRELQTEQLRRSLFTVRNTKTMLGQKR